MNAVDEAVDAWHAALGITAGLGASLARDILNGYPLDVIRVRAELVTTSDRVASDAFDGIRHAYEKGVGE